jgi:hypothetical protein
MKHDWVVMSRRRALTLLLFLLLVAPIPLMDIAQMNDPHRSPPPAGPNWFWLCIVFVLMGSTVRGNRSALALWAVLSGVIGTSLVIWGFSAQNGSVRFLGGFLGIAASIVFLLIRDEVATGSARIVEEREGVHSR